jgi:sarcosine oxidase subunit delta
MKLLTCPMNGIRNIDEFQCFGPVRLSPDPDSMSDSDWARYLFCVDNRKGLVIEWWRHVPSNYFFLAERDLISNQILRTGPASEFERKS